MPQTKIHTSFGTVTNTDPLTPQSQLPSALVDYTGSRGYSGSKGYDGSRGQIGYTGSGSLGYAGSRGATGPQGTPGGATGATGAMGTKTWVPVMTGGVITTDGSTFIKNSGNNSNFDAQVYSVQGFVRGVYASASAPASSSNHVMFGLNANPSTSSSYPMNYGIYFGGSTISISEDGSAVYTGGGYTTNDIMTITFDGGNVRYWQNGTLLKTTARSVSTALYFDSSFFEVGAQLNNVAFGPMGEIGNTGSVGFTGSQGVPGAYAAMGYTGSFGATGFTGSIGNTGPIGATGFIGSAGAIGATGFIGSAGYTGSVGFTGSQGVPGAYAAVGYTGSFGATGPQGTPGGATGATGAVKYTLSDTVPISPTIGDIWLDATSGVQYFYINDGTSDQWVEFANSGVVGATGATGAGATGATGAGATGATGAGSTVFTIALSDEETSLTTRYSVTRFRAPWPMSITQIPRSSVSRASNYGVVTVDIKSNGTSILGANKLSIDATEKTSTTAAIPTTLTSANVLISDDSEITFDIVAGGGFAAGLKINLYYNKL